MHILLYLSAICLFINLEKSQLLKSYSNSPIQHKNMTMKNPECDFQLQDLVFAKCKKSKPWPAQVIQIMRARPKGISIEEYIYKVKFIGHPSTSNQRSAQLEYLNQESIKKYRKMYNGTKDAQQLAILKSIGKALNKKTEMQSLFLPVKIQQIQSIKNIKQSTKRGKQKPQQKQIKIEQQQEEIVNKQVLQKSKQRKLIEKIQTKKQTQKATKIIKRNIQNRIKSKPKTKTIVKIEENPSIILKDKLPPNSNQVAIKIEQYGQEPHPKEKVRIKRAPIQKIPPKYGIKTLSFNSQKKCAAQADCTFRLPYKPCPLTESQKNKQIEPQGVQLFENYVNILESRRYVNFVSAKDYQISVVQSFDLSLLTKVQIDYSDFLEQNLTNLKLHDFLKKDVQIQLPKLEKKCPKVTKKIVKSKKRQKKRKGKQQKIQIRLKSQFFSTYSAPQLESSGQKQNEYLALLKCFPEQQKMIAKQGVIGWAKYVIKIMKTLIGELKVSNSKPVELDFTRNQRLCTIFGKKQLTPEVLLMEGILQLIVQFLKKYEISQVAIKKALQIQHHFLTTKVSVWKDILLKNCTKMILCKSKKIWLHKLLKQQAGIKKK